MRVDIGELKEFQRDVEQLIRAMPREVEEIITAGGQDLKRAVDNKTKGIKRTGKYHRSNRLDIERGHTIAAEVSNKSKHAHLVEYGTGPRRQKKTGRYTGVMPETAPFRSAFDENEARLSNQVTSKVLDLIEGRLAR